jgi:hypothetical protein
MEFPANYTLDTEAIKLDAYRLLCLFLANKEIARQADPANRDDPLTLLEKRFFTSEVTKLLLNIAISLRVLDDQMNALPNDSPQRDAYSQTLSVVNKDYSISKTTAYQCSIS